MLFTRYDIVDMLNIGHERILRFMNFLTPREDLQRVVPKAILDGLRATQRKQLERNVTFLRHDVLSLYMCITV